MTLREQIKALVTNIAGDIKAVKASIASLSTTVGATETLATNDKTSIVSAINEVNTKAAAGVSTESLNIAVFAEVTHNSDKSETYIDVYKKWENYCVKD